MRLPTLSAHQTDCEDARAFHEAPHLYGLREALIEQALEQDWCSVKTLGCQFDCAPDYAGQVIHRVARRRLIFRRIWGRGYEYRIFPQAFGVRVAQASAA